LKDLIMRAFTVQLGLGAILLAAVCAIPDTAQALFRHRHKQAACCPTTAYAAPMAAYPARGVGFASPCCGGGSALAYGTPTYYGPNGMAYGTPTYPGSNGFAYGSQSYYQPSGIVQAGYPVPVPEALPGRTIDRATEVKARISDNGFEPATLTVAPGTTVRWVNEGKQPHGITSSKGDWASGDIAPGAEFTATFTKPGTFEYSCRFNKDMKGTVVVK
jgi:plastocyanin